MENKQFYLTRMTLILVILLACGLIWQIIDQGKWQRDFHLTSDDAVRSYLLEHPEVIIEAI